MINRIYDDKLTGLSNKHYSGIFCSVKRLYTYNIARVLLDATDLFESQETNCHESFFSLKTFLSDEPAVHL